MRHLVHALVWARRHLAGRLPAKEIHPLLRCLAADDVFLDVGVHAGSWSIPASRRLTRGEVLAFEAFPYYARVLRATLALLGRRNITVVPAAVTDREGTLDVVWRDASGRRLTGMTHISRSAAPGTAVRVPAITLDRFLDGRRTGRVRLLKCDVEGAELLVFRGAVGTIERWRPLVFCELYDEYCAKYGYRARDVFAFFLERRYTCFEFDGHGFRPMDPATYSGTGDVLFVPSELDFAAACA